jgi:hypothetical protein
MPVYTVASDFNVKCKYYWVIFRCDSNPQYKYFFSLQEYKLINPTVNPSFKLNLLHILLPLAYSHQWVRTPSKSRLHGHNQTYHIQEDSSGWVISPSQGFPADKAQHSKEKNIHTASGIRTRNHSSKRPQTHDLHGAGTGTGIYCTCVVIFARKSTSRAVFILVIHMITNSY